MSTKTTLTVTLPDDTTATRTTKATYTHVVAVAHTPESHATQTALYPDQTPEWIARNVGEVGAWGVWQWTGNPDKVQSVVNKARSVYGDVRIIPVN